MFRFTASVLLFAVSMLILPPATHAEGDKLVSRTGNMLRGTVYKQSGAEREGVITIKTKWNMPAIGPIYRYDFDIMNGLIEDNLHSFMVGDIKEITVLPFEDGFQVLGVRLRNGGVHKIRLTTDKKALLGPVKVWFENVRVLTDGYGENIIPAEEITKIVFADLPAPGAEDMETLARDFERALELGVRDDLIEEHHAEILENLKNKIKKRLKDEKR